MLNIYHTLIAGSDVADDLKPQTVLLHGFFFGLKFRGLCRCGIFAEDREKIIFFVNVQADIRVDGICGSGSCQCIVHNIHHEGTKIGIGKRKLSGCFCSEDLNFNACIHSAVEIP